MPRRSTSVFDFLPESAALLLGISDAATISPVPQGMTSELAFVDDRDRQSVLKRCRNPIYVEWLRREHRVLIAVSECSLRMPRVLGYHEAHQDGRIMGAWLQYDTTTWKVALGRATELARPSKRSPSESR